MVNRHVGAGLGGAASGALTGSAFGPVGTGVGALVGGIGGYFGSKSNAFNTKEKETKFDKYTPEQQDLISQLMGALTGQGGPQGGLLGDLFGDKGFEAFAAPAKRQFNEEIIPDLAERFSGANAQNSSAFQQQLSKAGSDLSTRLGEARGQLQMNSLQNILSAVLGPQFERYFQPSGPSGLAQGLGAIAGGIGSGLGQGLGQGLGNKFGGMFQCCLLYTSPSPRDRS